MDVSEALTERVNSKIGKVLNKLAVDAISAHVVLRVVTNDVNEIHSQTTKPHSQIAEVTVRCKQGGVLHASEQTDDLYASIDIVSHRLAQALKRHSAKLRTKDMKRQAGNKEEAMLNAETIAEPLPEESNFDEEELLVDLEKKYVALIENTPKNLPDLGVVRPKKFKMPAISTEEAMSALELIDHPFYVFRNRETMEINVLYRRTIGGVGLIMPDTDE